MNNYIIPFNKPYLSGNETKYITEAVTSGKISGNGIFTRKCHDFFESKYRFNKVLLTTSCTDALEMAAILTNVKPGDEVIVPSYTFVSSALAFVRQGAHVVFVDSNALNPNLDVDKIEMLITERTKVIVAVHYAGIACDMGKVMALAYKYNLLVVEDAAQAIDSYYYERPLGSIAHLGTFSFHETKNISAGEGGMLVVNDQQFNDRAEIIWEKGTNRSAFFKGKINKYGWIDIGSSFLPSEIISAFLYAQLENLENIQLRRTLLWNYYYQSLLALSAKGNFRLPYIPKYSANNSHIFYIILQNETERLNIINKLAENGVLAVSHYISLHKSEYYTGKHHGRDLTYSDNYTHCLLRLPLYYDLTLREIDFIVNIIHQYYHSRDYAKTINNYN